MSRIVVEEYNPNWKTEFEKAKTFYLNLLGEIILKTGEMTRISEELKPELW